MDSFKKQIPSVSKKLGLDQLEKYTRIRAGALENA